MEGNVTISNQQLGRRDALEIWDTDSLSVKALADAQLLFIEVPLKF